MDFGQKLRKGHWKKPPGMVISAKSHSLESTQAQAQPGRKKQSDHLDGSLNGTPGWS
jgi:hypothetical protein